MHFFNPPAAMKLVDLRRRERSAPALKLATEVAVAMGRTPIRARGLGRLRRQPCSPVHAGAKVKLGEGLASHEEIDRVCRLGGGFRMGPFELMDLIGVDVNYAVARSFYEQVGRSRAAAEPHPGADGPRGAPGPKAGRGFDDDGRQAPRSRPARRRRTPAPGPRGAEGGRRPAGARGPGAHRRADRERGGFALEGKVAAPNDINTAMKLGFNWPAGSLEFAGLIGPPRAVETLDELRESRGDAYRAAPLLREAAERGTKL